MNNFEDMIAHHRYLISEEMNLICEYLQDKAKEHDQDKIKPGYVNDVYTEHYPLLKKIPYGSPEYKQYEHAHFKKAHFLHAQNRHHFDNPVNEVEDIDLFDVIESIVDIKQSQRQYSSPDKEVLLNILAEKGMFDLNLKELITNTVNRMDTLNNE